MGLFRTVCEINGDFGRKSQIFPTPAVYFVSPLKGSPWNWASALGIKKTRMMGLRSRENRFDDIFIHLDTIHQRDGRTDGRIDTGRQQRPRLRIAR